MCDIINGFRLGPAFLAHGIATFTVSAIFNELEGSHIIIDKVADLVIEVETEGTVCKARLGDVPLLGQALEATFGGEGRSNRCDEDD